MYNEEQKQAFLDGLINNHGDLYIKEYIAIFNNIEKYEEVNNCDISCFTYNQLIEMYEKINIRYSTKIKYNSKLTIYTVSIGRSDNAFCKAKDYLAKKYNDSITKQSDKSHSVSYNKVMQFINTLENPSDKFLIYGLFCGISGTNYVELSQSSMEDSDPNTGLIWLAGYDEDGNINLKHRKFIADRDLFQMALESSKSENYNTKYKDGIKKSMSIPQDGQRILKRIKKDNERDYSKAHRSTIINRCKSIVKDTDFDYLNPCLLYWSGAAYEVRKMAVNLGKDSITAKEAMQLPEFKKIRDQYDFRIEDRSLVLKLEWYLQ